MASDIRPNLLIGILGIAVVAAGIYGFYQESGRAGRSIPGGSAQGAGSGAASAAGNAQGALRIEAPRAVSSESSGHESRILGPAGLQCIWSIEGGKLESDNFRDTVTWSAGPTGVVVLSCRAIDGTGSVTVAENRIPILPAPIIEQFQAAPPVMTSGRSARLGWTARDFRRLVLDPGARDVSSLGGPGLEVQPAETTEYTLTAIDDLGTTVVRKTTVRVVPAPVIGALRVEPRPGTVDAFTLVGEFKGGKAELRSGSTVLASATESPLQADLSDVKAGSSISFVVTNEAGAKVTAALDFAARKP